MRKRALRSMFVLVGAVLLAISGVAQVSTASVNGVVRDPSGAVIPNASIVLHNFDTSVDNTTTTNKSGVYSIVSIKPGRYSLEATSSGFSPKRIDSLSLTVSQIATLDFTLIIGSQSTVVTVQASTAQLNLSDASLGTVIGTRQTNDLPLNGRNFTELLTLTPGVTSVNTAQNSGGGFSTPSVITSDVVIPAINGQGNRSNMFLADGLNNFDNIVSTYTVPPIIDAIQEFKVVSHTDSAEYGGVLGGVIDVDTKSGTNDLHGSAWEYARNSIFDARSYFLPKSSQKTPFSQNQFGGAVGGPVVLPKLYHGRNKTFFFGAYQGFRFLQTSDSPLHVPTPAELSGDLSDQPTVYNPFTTVRDPNHPGQYTASPFPGNQIPQSLIKPGLVAYAQFAYPAAGAVFDSSGDNALDKTPVTQNQNEWNIRIDQKIGANDSAFFRYSAINSTEGSSGGLPGAPTASSLPGRDWGGSYVHVFGHSLVLQSQFARILQQEHVNTVFSKSIASVQSALGFDPTFGSNWIDNANILPGISISNYSNTSESLSYNDANDGYEYSAHLTKTLGSHAIQFGGGFTTLHFGSNNTVGGESFSAQNTADPSASASSAVTGSPLASFLLGVPNSAYRVNKISATRKGGVLSGFVQDSWKTTKNLTLNVGLRYDLTFIPPLGQDALTPYHGGPYIGDMDFTNGTYVLQKLPPACTSTSNVAPCIPGDGTLPANVVVSSNGKIAQNTYDNLGPRLGFAYRAGTNIVIHGGFGIVYDNWAALLQTIQNTGGTWPDVGGQQNSNLNLPSSASAIPTIPYTSPFGASGNGGLAPGASPFTQQNYFYDPHRKNPRSYQYNFGLQQQLNSTTTATLNYVGQVTKRLDVGGFYNTALTPGPGDPQTRSLYPNIVPTPYDRSTGSSSYNGLQASLNRQFQDGWSYSVAYTWSKTIDAGTDGFFGAEGGVPQDPYNPSAYGSRSVAGYDVPNNFSLSLLYQVPYGVGKQFSSKNFVVNYLLGNWQINNIFVAYSGLPFTPMISSDIANTGNGNTYETLDKVGNPDAVSHRGPGEWFNTAAYAIPALYTYGSTGRNSLRTAGFRNLDTSLFRQFPIGEGRQFEFRLESFNLLNEVVLGRPNSDINSGSQFGTINGTANSARQLQLALKFAF